MIWRAGEQITIKRPDGSETENIFGKKDDTDVTFSTVSSDEYGYRYEPTADSRDRSGTVPGGRVRTHEPHIALALDTAVQQDDLIEFPNGDQYAVTAPLVHENNHKIAKVTLRNQ